MNANIKTILIAIGISIVVGFGICYLTIVLPASRRAAIDLRASNELAKQYKEQADGSAKTVGDMQTTIDGQKLDISKLRSEADRIAANNKRLDETNKQLERDKGQLTDQLGFFSDYYNKSQQQDKRFGEAIDTAQGAVSSALDDLRSIQVNQ
jgi:septal ring factor EnvC (AmiA/AmiB activator)